MYYDQVIKPVKKPKPAIKLNKVAPVLEAPKPPTPKAETPIKK